MKNLLNPKWLLLINTMPLILFFIIFYGEYNIVKSLLPIEADNNWKFYGSVLCFLGVLNFFYAIFLILKKKPVSVFYGVIALVCYISFLYAYFVNYDEIIPFSIPNWMLPESLSVYVGTFLMPTLAYSLFLLVSFFTPEDKENSSLKSFLFAVSIPLIWFLFTQLVMPLWRISELNIGIHTIVIFFIANALLFLFFLIRAIYILALNKASKWKRYELAWKIPIAIVFPIIGLLVNSGRFLDFWRGNETGIFGNFNSPVFYVLAILNGIFICLPHLENRVYKLTIFTLRSITLAYTFYFFLVFLPFLPFSILAIIAAGVGFLMLTPLALFVLHIVELSKDIQYLKQYFSTKIIRVISILGFLVLPTLITLNYLKDKEVLNETLSFLYAPDYSKEYQIDTTSVRNTINLIAAQKDKNGSFLMGSSLPYLSALYNWIVLDNLTLSDAKINHIENVFFDKQAGNFSSSWLNNEDVNISKISAKSTYDASQKAWKSWVDLEIKNNTNFGTKEFATTLHLPDGCWISDYYLYVEGKKEMGLLAEKKAAMWVFSQIRNTNRDPGILHYLTGNKVAFRVFPFSNNELRKTGFELIHKEPFVLNVDSNFVVLGDTQTLQNNNIIEIADKNIIFVPKQQKSNLQQVNRKPYFHFIVDASTSKSGFKDVYIKRIEAFIKAQNTAIKDAKISFVNKDILTLNFNENWKEKYSQLSFNGGFYLDRAIKKTLFHSVEKTTNTYPIIIVVSDILDNAIIDNDFADLKFTYPETNLFYNLTDEGQINAHSLYSNPKNIVTKNTEINYENPVFVYPNSINAIAYLPINMEGNIVINSNDFKVIDFDIKEKNWESGLAMQGMWNSQILHPDNSDKEWKTLVKNSFQSKIMNPFTSYIVVENEAQKAMILKKQKEMMSGNKSLDLGEESQSMSEPSLIIIAILFGVFLYFNEKRKAIKTKVN